MSTTHILGACVVSVHENTLGWWLDVRFLSRSLCVLPINRLTAEHILRIAALAKFEWDREPET